ncbi:MAG: PEGA domain-containing protein [Deltaproteobacteria bacterium]|nr:PEGA domain-containing protein [Deltaproteobacteria bacterium]
MLRALAITVGIACAAGGARADRVVAVTPLSTLGTEDTSQSTRALVAQIEQAVGALGGDWKVVTSTAVADAIKKAKKPQLRACEGEARCLAEVGKLVGAHVVIAGEIGGLGDARVVYLGATDVATGKELRSTTLAVGGSAAAARDADGGPHGAVVRLLEPDRFRGTLRFAVDVKGATIYVNGAKTAPSAAGDVALPVGRHAVRVTHPEYSDFVRFIDVPYNKTTPVTVGMHQYPIVKRDLLGKPIARDTVIYERPPWYRRWYVVGTGAVVLAIVSGVVVGTLAGGFPDAPCRKVGGASCD